ncbi:MAG TPA: VCBS repeat-containing protein, partial [Thermoanaerobaculia bacterium]|nr:VCBS repeat-containing protein [Thermoanaerobaculia bacterium]
PVAPALPLSPFDDGLPQAGQWRDGFAIADMNEDGRPDLVHAPPRKALGSPPVIYLGDGAGHWRPWSEARFPADLTYDYGDVAVADFDHDGHLDMALAMHVIGMNVLLGDGKGSFRDASTGIEPSAGAKENRFTSRAVRALDWDGDGWPDLVALGEGMSLIVGGSGPPKPLQGGLGIAVYRNLHDGRWERAALLDSVVHGNTMAFGDFDGDGRRDLVVAASVLGLRRLVYLGKEAGRWEERELDVRPRAFITAVTTGDLDGDHRDDIALSYVGVEGDEARSGIDLFLSHTAGGELTWQRQGLAVMPGRDGYTALTIGDLDGDGRNEVIVLDGSGGLQTFLGKGGGKFAAAAKAPIPPPLGGCAGYDVQLQDLDGDGRPELVAEFAGEEGSAAVLAMVIGPQPSCRSNGAIRAWKLTAEPAR